MAGAPPAPLQRPFTSILDSLTRVFSNHLRTGLAPHTCTLFRSARKHGLTEYLLNVLKPAPTHAKGESAKELLRTHLGRVWIPEPSNRICKEECCIPFNTPHLDGTVWNYEKTGNPVYLNIVEIVKPISEDRPHKKPTLPGIAVGGRQTLVLTLDSISGIEGGFNSKEPEYEQSYSVVILPDFASFSFPSVRLCVDGVLAAMGTEHKEQLAAWTADKKTVSAYARDLQQLDDGEKLLPHSWKRDLCDKADNLWLNLTDGSILCGRQNWDGTGGNEHALQHYHAIKYPLAVKVGTITADLEAAGVLL